MRVVAFAPALSAAEEDAGGLSASGFPMTSCHVDEFPADISIPMVVVVCALSGGEYDPVLYIVATSPEGERVSAMEFSWHWDDEPETPVKFRVFLQNLPLHLTSAGLYTIGLHDSLDVAATDTQFPLVVHQSVAAGL
jgi:hypothetical protein